MASLSTKDSGFDVAFGVLKRRKWAGIVTFVAALSLALPFAIYLPDVYRGEATVIVENQDAAAAVVHGPVPELEARLITIEQELLSRVRLSDLILRLNLYPAWRAHAPMEGLVQRLRRDLRVELSRSDRGRPTTIGLKISYIGLDAKSAAAVPNALAAMYVEENTRIREGQTAQIAQFLKRQLEGARQTLDDQQARLDRYKTARAGELPEQVSLNMVSLERLNTRLRLNLDDQLRIRERRDRSGTAAEPTADPLQDLRHQLAELQSKFTDRHPDVIRIKAQIADLERQRAAHPERIAAPRAEGSADGELDSLQREERTLRSEIAAYEQRIQEAPKIEQELEALEHDYSTAKESYGSMLKRYEEAQLADRLEQTKKADSFRILDVAVVPTFPAAPNRMRLLLMAFFLAGASGVAMMLLTEHLDTSFHSLGELRQFTTVPILASIPYVNSRPTMGSVLRIAACAIAVIAGCVMLAAFAYHAAHGNTQLVWMLSAPQL